MAEDNEACAERSLLGLVDLLYDAALDPGRWRAFLDAGSEFFSAFGANLIHYLPEFPERSLAMLTGLGDGSTESLADAVSRFVSLRNEDPRLLHGFSHPNMPFHCRQAVTTETLHSTRTYREVLAPNGVEYTLLVTFNDTPNAFTGFAFIRNRDARPFSDRDVEHLGLLVPHLRRTLMIHDRLGLVNHATQTTYQVLEGLPTGIAILHVDGRLDYANAVARTILARCDGLSIQSGKVVWRCQRGLDDQEGLLRHIVEDDAHHALVINRTSGRTPYRCVLNRLRPTVAKGLPNLLAVPRVVLCLTDPDRPCETSEELLQRMFGLTPAEARLAQALVAGQRLQEAADQIGIQPSTARSRLKDIFRKTGTNSQSKLVHVVLTSPLWHAGTAGI